MTPSWEPVRRGNIYCSPACGANCTQKAFEKATKDAAALAKKCSKEVGGIWEPRVWENLGWHYNVSLKEGDITIYPTRTSRTIFMVMSSQGGTPSQVFVDGNWKIGDLVSKQLSAVAAEAAKWNNYLKRNRKALQAK